MKIITLKKAICFVMSAVFMLILAVPAFALSVSPALDVIATEYGLKKVSLVSRDVYFEKEDFENASGLDKVNKINIVSLPDANSGTLMLGGIALSENQSISEKNLDNVRFVPRVSGVIETNFKFTVNDGTTGAYTCSVYLLDRENAAPTVSDGGDCYLEVSTYGGITLYGVMKATDPENDPVSFEITKMPEHGKLALENKKTGSYRYTPDSGYTGTDRFSYVASDKYGNLSETATVSVKVDEPDSNIVFADMGEHWAHGEAIRVAESGIMDFGADGTSYTFEPDTPVSRAEFCAALMKCAGYDGFTSVNGTGFADDKDIKDEHKGLISAASILGVASGYPVDTETYFYPNNQITRAEAAVMINKIYGFEYDGSIAVFADEESVPAWAHSSLAALTQAGVMKGDSNGNVSAYDGLTRAHTAVLMSNLMKVRK